MDPELLSQILYVAELQAESRANVIKERELEHRAQALRDKNNDISRKLVRAKVKLDSLADHNN